MLASRNKAQNEQFNDGVINVLEAEDGIIKKNLFNEISFGNRTFGVKRFMDAKVSGNTIERMISIPMECVDVFERSNIIETRDYRTGKKGLYEIVLKQPKYDTAPPSIYITLKGTDIKYVDKRNNQQT